MTNEEIKLITDAVTQSVTENLSQLIDKKLEPIYEQLENIKEDTEITRTTTNEIVEWIDEYFREDYPFPVGTTPKKAI